MVGMFITGFLTGAFGAVSGLALVAYMKMKKKGVKRNK